MEKKKTKTKKKTTMQEIKNILTQLWKGMKKTTAQIGRLPFWRLALICFAFRLLVICPLGAVTAVITSCIWLYWNLSFFKALILKGLWVLLSAFGGIEQHSLWFEHEGREEIRAVIGRLSEQGINQCNLVEQIDDLPPETQWFAICNDLNAMGITTQTARHALYITWHLPTAAAV